MKIQESTEMYLETILILSKDNAKVRAIDIASTMGFSKPSVSIAMKKMKGNALIEIDSDGFITLTNGGQEIAERMYTRHTWISEWLMSLGVTKDIAIADACKIEHVISEETFKALKQKLSPLPSFRA